MAKVLSNFDKAAGVEPAVMFVEPLIDRQELHNCTNVKYWEKRSQDGCTYYYIACMYGGTRWTCNTQQQSRLLYNPYILVTSGMTEEKSSFSGKVLDVPTGDQPRVMTNSIKNIATVCGSLPRLLVEICVHIELCMGLWRPFNDPHPCQRSDSRTVVDGHLIVRCHSWNPQ